jgi:YegS/Rv2252/BmrU family lipid kinase
VGAYFILNPAAGHGRGRARWDSVRRLAAELWPNHEVLETEAPGHARTLARLALDAGAETVIAVGGDGTLGEVVDGFLSYPAERRAASAVATFPAGSGCDFARHMGVPREPEAWAAALRVRRVRRLDAALARFRAADGAAWERRFLNVAALGLAGDVALGVERRGKPLGGTLTYLLEGVIAAVRARPRRMTLVVDGVAEAAADYHLVVLANTSTSGGGMCVAPGADPADGALDLLTVGAMSRAALLGLLPRVYGGGHLGAPGVRLRRVKKLELSGEDELPLNIDGDLEGRAPAQFEILPGAVPFLL